MKDGLGKRLRALAKVAAGQHGFSSLAYRGRAAKTAWHPKRRRHTTTLVGIAEVGETPPSLAMRFVGG